MENWRIGVDSGGTFTDVCLFREGDASARVWKVPSTPDDPSRAIAEGVAAALAEHGGAARAVSYLGHGTTVATNALIQGRGARTGLVTSAGFRDLLEIRRQMRPSLYDLQCDKPEPMVPRRLRYEVPERLRHDGRVETPLDEDAVHAAAVAMRAAGVGAVAIAFLYAFVDPSHERRARAIVEAALPDAFITCSHEVAPEFREYERFSTTAVNARLGPIMAAYVNRLEQRVAALNIPAPPHITQSNGGVISCATAATEPVRTVLSGPSTGVVGAIALGQRAGVPDLITFDMGGTSTDVALVRDGQALRSGQSEVHGHPLRIPMLDIHTVGAGGGSIARIDTGGLLKVGPQSAGAAPGPACYAMGSSDATVTDANVVLGVLHPTHLLAGRMPIDKRLAEAAVDRLAAPLGLGREAAAQGIVSIVVSNMAKAIRVISVQRGHDPRHFALMAFGGAGPIHAARLARELDCPRIVVPPHPGILCATGLLMTDMVTDYARTRLTLLEGAAAVIDQEFAALEQTALAWFEAEGIAADARTLQRSIDMRYAGQNYELSIPADDPTALRAAFEAEHTRMYGYIAPEEPIQLVTFRVEATGRVPKSEFREAAAGTGQPTAEGWRQVWLPEADGWTEVPLFARATLGAGQSLTGPAIVEQMDSTTLILPGQTARIDRYANIVIEEAP